MQTSNSGCCESRGIYSSNRESCEILAYLKRAREDNVRSGRSQRFTGQSSASANWVIERTVLTKLLPR